MLKTFDTEWTEVESTTEITLYGNAVEWQYAHTDDPRVLAVIEREADFTIENLYDGGGINPIIYVEHRFGLKFRHVAGYDGGEAELMQRAYDEWGWNGIARRWLWIFHGIAAENADGGQDRDGNWIVATSASYTSHVGNEPHATYDDAREDCASIAQDLTWALDGEVYGVGYAVNEARVIDMQEDIDLDDGNWEVEIACWGMTGEKYAREEAAQFAYGEPDLPELLEMPREAFEEHTDRMSRTAAEGA